ncbi:Uncharacterised protein [Klebsiella pneumoniae]|nr:Uncharacterised protein [Klebsiella pneumoniae]
MQAVELLVCQPDQIIQRQPLGEFAEPVAGAGADQRIEIAPVVRQLRRLCNLLPQRLLLLTALCVLPELLADLTLAGSVIPQPLGQGVQLGLQGGDVSVHPLRTQRQVRLMLPGRLLAERSRLLKLLLQRLF